MKKKLALLLVASMVLSSVTATVYGKSANSISRVVAVKVDTKLDRDWDGEIPRLDIVSDESLPIAIGSTIRLTLNGAQWLDGKEAADCLLHSGDILVSGPSPDITAGDISVNKISASQIELVMGSTASKEYVGNSGARPLSSRGDTKINFAYDSADGIALQNQTTDNSGNYGAELYAPLGSGGYFEKRAEFTLNTGVEIGFASQPDVGEFSENRPVLCYGLEAQSIQGDNLFSVEKNTIGTGKLTFRANGFGSNTQPGWFEGKYQVFLITWTEARWNNPVSQGHPMDYTEITETVKRATFTIYPNAEKGASTIAGEGSIGVNTVVSVPMLVEVMEEGEATVTIESVSGNVTGSEEIFATVQTGNTMASSDGSLTIPSGNTSKRALKNIIINEVTAGALNGNTYIRFKVPEDFELYVNANSFHIAVAGGLANTYADGIKTSGSPYVTFSGEGTNELTLYFWDAQDQPHEIVSYGAIGTMILSGLQIRVTDEAPFGSINMTIHGNQITKESFRVANYRDYGVTMAATEPLPVIVSGYHPGTTNNIKVTEEDEIEMAEITIKEGIASSLWKTRKMELSVPEGVEIRAAVFKDSGSGTEHILYRNNDSDSHEERILNFTEVGTKYSSGSLTLYDDRLEFLNVGNTSKSSFYIKLFVSVEPGYSGDIDVILSGGGLEEDLRVTAAQAVNPVGISTEQTNIALGYKNVAVQDIIITENIAGAIKKGYTPVGADSESTARLEIQIEDGNFLFFGSVASYEVAEGDIILDSVKVRDGQIQLEVKTESTEPSTIILKGIAILTDRTPPEGAYSLNIGGKAVFSNFDKGNESYFGFFDTQWLELEKAYIVTTAAEGSGFEFIPFVQLMIGSNQMQVGADMVAMDAEPYISRGRTMVPVRYVANAFGIGDEQIYYDAANKTITFVTALKTVQFQVGSAMMISNGIPVPMDAVPEITGGRTYIPVAWLAIAFGIGSPSWDEDNKTVTFNEDLVPEGASIGIEIKEGPKEEEAQENRRGGGRAD